HWHSDQIKMADRQFPGPRLNTHSLPSRSLSLPRKEDQYKLLMKIRGSALCGDDVFCPKSLHTTPTVNKTTRYFNKKDGNHVSNDIMKNGSEQMEKCSKTFSLIIKNSPPLYSSILTDIKWGYDSYLNTLLHQSVDYWKAHQDQSDTSCSEATPVPYPPSPTATATGGVREREGRGGHQGQTNERLDKILSEEKELEQSDLSQFDDEDIPGTRTEELQDVMVDYTDHVTHLQQLILNQRSEALSSINHRLEQVPLSVCQKLEQCIRSTELCIQQLMKQNSILIANVQELEKKLQRYFDILRTPKNDIEILLATMQERALMK
uniref:Uncharacterized protein n=2 Tax=Amphimedon queenslandica TaxID=400682 RepID=A0A1X7USU4_AMPQE